METNEERRDRLLADMAHEMSHSAEAEEYYSRKDRATPLPQKPKAPKVPPLAKPKNVSTSHACESCQHQFVILDNNWRCPNCDLVNVPF